MRKVIVIVALILLVTGIVSAVSIQGSHTEEVVLYMWNPITPAELPRNNETGWAFMLSERSNATFLELNITSSDIVRVRVGYIIAGSTGEAIWGAVVFNVTGERFTQRVAIAGTDADFLGIKNEWNDNVTLSGDIKKIGNKTQPVYPYLGLGTSVAIFGLILLVYGVSVKSRKRHFEGKSNFLRICNLNI